MASKLPGTPREIELEKGHQESEEGMAKRAIDKSFSNSHANLMNEGEDDDWRDSYKRSQIEDRRSDKDSDDDSY